MEANEEGLNILQLYDVFRRVLEAAKLLNLSRRFYITFVSQLRDIRETQNVSQAELAKRMNVSQSKISMFENLRLDVKRNLKPNMGTDFLDSYANALGYRIIPYYDGRYENTPAAFTGKVV